MNVGIHQPDYIPWLGLFYKMYLSDVFVHLDDALPIYIAGKFGIKPKFVRSSEFHFETKREEKVIDLCVAVGGTRYISGNGARVYQAPEHFAKRGVELTYLEYKPIEYPQLWKEFLPCMSALDYIFNCGYDWDYVVKKVEGLNERDR